ncbi:MAG: Crp/Fnr family transcriptional regulator [Bacteroidota bacterium]
MPETNLLNFLQSSSHLSVLKAKEVADCFRALHISKGDFLLREGQVSDTYYFLESGFMRAFAINTEGNDITTGFYSPGRVVFEVASFFNRLPSGENLLALTDCRGYVLSFEELNRLFHSMPEFREFGRSILVKGFAELKQRMLATITETAPDRYNALVKANPEILQHVPLKHIATFLGITDSSLSRIRKELSVRHA